jgi:hypothetical protein
MVQTTTKPPMKKTLSLKSILGLAILAWTLSGSQSVQNASAQTTQTAPPPGTDLITAASPDNATTPGTLPPDVDPNSPLAQVIRLVQASVEQSVILTYIGNSTSLFSLNSDEIIYLNDLGAPPEIANAMMQHDRQLQQAGVAANVPPAQPGNTAESSAAPPADTAETMTSQPADVTVNYFYDTLTPYGGWVNVTGYGWCWQPTIVVYNTDWQPYCDDGHWVYTDCGWYWISGYSWGWATFHYGRWFHVPRYGWCWWPDTTWAPSWVCWRYNRDYCGWAPLPPHAVYQPGVGFVYQGRAVSAGFNFGLSAGVFTFVPTRDFCDPHPGRFRIKADGVTHIYNQTAAINNFNFDSHRQGIVNAGIPPQDITAVTRQAIHPVTIRTGNGSVAWGGRGEQFERNNNTLTVSRPRFVGTPVLSLHPGTPPTTGHGQNEFHPVVQGNQNNISPHVENPGQNTLPHRDIQPNSQPNLYRTPPRVPQTQQPDVTHVTPSNPQINYNNHTVTAPSKNYQTWPTQNQTPNHNDNSDGKVLSPRAFGSGQQPSHGATYNSPPQGNTANGQPFSSPPPVNHYSPPPTPNNNYGTPANESGNNSQRFYHSDPPPQVVQPHASNPSPPPPPQPNNQGQGKDQNGH